MVIAKLEKIGVSKDEIGKWPNHPRFLWKILAFNPSINQPSIRTNSASHHLATAHGFSATMIWSGLGRIKGMGAASSNLTENGSDNGRPGLGDIPESCVACVFTYLTPPEICNLARLNRAFRGAASSDSVWEAKLPANYHQLLHLLPQDRCHGLSKKEIFALLSRSVPFDDANKACGLFLCFVLQSFYCFISSFCLL